MKKFVSIILTAFLLLAVTGCTPLTNEPEDTSADNTPEETTATEETTMENVIEDTTREEEETEETKTGPVLYQIAADENMLQNAYLIKTKNGKYILIDGGGAGSANTNYLAHALRDLTGTTQIEIEAWFLSHMHDDHVTEFILLSQHPRAQVKVNNIYMNFPSREFMNTSERGESAYLYDGIQSAYDHFIGEGEFEKTGGKTAFTGDVIEIDGVKIEILMTVTDEETESNINDTSMIFKVTIEGQTILFLGDAYIPEGNRLLEKYGDDLKCDIVQMAHHGQNGVSEEVYKAIDPTLCLWPTPIWVFENNAGIYKTDEVRGWMADMGVKYHIIAGEHLTQSLTFPVDFDSLEEYSIRKVTN